MKKSLGSLCLVLLFVLASCAEQKAREEASALDPAITDALVAGDTETAEVLRNRQAELEGRIPAAREEDDWTWGLISMLVGAFGGGGVAGTLLTRYLAARNAAPRPT